MKMPVFVSIGSNVDREANIRYALDKLAEHYGPLKQSTIYKSAPVGFTGDDFLNLVVGFETAEDLETVSATLAAMESTAGRRRPSTSFSPRTLDLDLLLYGDLIRHDDRYDLPRNEIRQYAFVLRPLAEIAPHYRHPELGLDFQTLLQQTDFSEQPLTAIKLDGVGSPA